ncbi:MAG TPA: DUF47 family protein [Feifaniaceae bacterium]|nr:DUF47 family protein [Feifaniaceae bacterium]
MLKRKETLDFYSILIQQAQVICDTVRALCVFCNDPTTENGDFVKAKEREADQVHYQLVDAINHTFITPIDRDDLFRLSTSIDDLADYAWTTVKDLHIYDILPDKNLASMVSILLQMAEGLLLCVNHLRNNRAQVAAEAKKVKKLENVMNVRYHESIAELFTSDDFKKILKYREIYSHMNHASDKGDMCANLLQDIVVKL